MMYSNLGSARIRLNELDAAATAFDSAIRLQRQLHSIAPAVQLHRRDLAMSLNNIAMVRYRQSKPTDSAISLQEGVELQRSLVAAGSNTVDRTRLGAMEHNRAVALIALNETDRAEALFTQAINRQKSVLIETPEAKASTVYLRQHYLASLRSQVRRGQWTKMRATESALRESAGGNSQTLNEIETEIRSSRMQQTRNQPKYVPMVSP